MEKNELTNNRVLIIGGSAGSLDIILKIIPELPSQANAVFIIVVHRKNEVSSILRDLIASRTLMIVKEVEDKDPIQLNHIYIAPPDYHLLVENSTTFSLDSSEKIHYSRPSIDVSFESVAEVFGEKVIALLLSGANADGAAGLQQVHRAGGFSIVQDPSSAEMDFMPRQGIAKGNINAIVTAAEIPTFISNLLRQ